LDYFLIKNGNIMDQRSIYILTLSMLLVMQVVISGCNKDEPSKPVLGPVLSTISIGGITQTSAITGGYITDDGGAKITARGVCWSTNSNPTLADNITSDGNGSGSFVSSISGLTLNTVYYVRAYATNSAGTSYGNVVCFKSLSFELPVIKTYDISGITFNSVLCGGNITYDGLTPILEKGVCWTFFVRDPVISDSKLKNDTNSNTFTVKITGLSAYSAYYVRAYAINSVGINYGETKFCRTLPQPILTSPITLPVKGVTLSSVIAEGMVPNSGYGNITEKGFCWNSTGNPTINDNRTMVGGYPGNFSYYINNLIENTTYYLRAYSTNEAGTAYGNIISFKTSSKNSTTVQDIDGNIYHTITIGDQVWMVENLKTTRYRNGDSMMNISDFTSWSDLRSGAYCDYNNNSDNALTYGRLYNWYAINDNRKIAPEGWHVAFLDEWQTLINYLGGEYIAGGKLKETGFSHWSKPNIQATNETGFTALPGGERNYYFNFRNYKKYGFWWCSSESDPESGFSIIMYYQTGATAMDFFLKTNGLSVRCIKDD
jgi:uncharacterized protein (TIGR02145 family)